MLFFEYENKNRFFSSLRGKKRVYLWKNYEV